MPGRLVDAASDADGGVDIAVLSSGGPSPSTAASLTAFDVDEQVRPMLTSLIELANLVALSMRDARWGRVVAVGSGGVQEPIAGLVLSNVLRAGLAAYVKTLAGEVAGDGVTVNMVLPGMIETDRIGRLNQACADAQGIALEEVAAAAQRSIPAGRYGMPTEFAALVVFLCSEQAGYLTGEQIRVDGGMARSY